MSRTATYALDAASFPSCAQAKTVRAACLGLVDDLHARWDLPSVYLLVDGRLRCQASRGYFQVADGFTPSTGVIGRVVTTRTRAIIEDVALEPAFVAAIPGLRSEACIPLWVFGEVVGAVNLESRTSLDAEAVTSIEFGAAFLGRKIEALGGLQEPSLAERLARIAVELAGLTGIDEIRQRAVSGAIEISRMSSAAIVRWTGGEWTVRHAAGPLAHVLRTWDDSALDILGSHVRTGGSSYFPDGEDLTDGYEFLTDHIHALSVHPLVVTGRIAGLLITAGGVPAAHDPALTAAMDLLATQTAATLARASTMEELASQAAHDPLTGLSNRRNLLEELQSAVVSGSAALVLLDLDGFKAVNDLFGHAHGDVLLCDVARRLQRAAREGDVVCRLGGDEFAVLVRGVRSHAAAELVGARFVAAVKHGSHPGGELTIGASAGVKLISGGSPSSVLVDADVALYAAKHSGRGKTVVWEPALRQEELDHDALVGDLRQALADDALTLDYQPVVDIRTLRVRGIEALARWHHPTRGSVPPSVFVAYAEQAGIVRDLTRWVLRTAFREAATWPAPADGKHVNIAVNISAAQLADTLVVSDVAQALQASGLPAHRVVLEVTETAEVVDLALAKTTLEALAALGVGLALDDFGTGYSSLTHAQTLPFDILKIDRSFVAASAAGDRRAIATIAAICALAARLDVDVVAEGVEDQGQLGELIALGCNHAQGYALARPLPRAEVTRAMAHQGSDGWLLGRTTAAFPTLTAVPEARTASS